MRPAPLAWMLVFAFLVAGFGATVLALNGDLYSAHGFVRSYLQALERQDADEALAFSGVVVPGSEDATLLVDDALGRVGDIRLLSDAAVAGSAAGEHVVRFAYVVDGAEQITEFRVERDGATLGLFSRWRFASSPLARIEVSVAGGTRFTANGAEASAAAPLLVLAPGSYEIDNDTRMLSSAEQTLVVTTIGDTESASIAAEPTDDFTAAAGEAVATYLDDCATQRVLMPTGCPFGFAEANRVASPPVWTVTQHPTVTLEPGEVVGSWRAVGSAGEVRIAVSVTSLFDGSTRTVDERVAVNGSYDLRLGADDSVTVLGASG